MSTLSVNVPVRTPQGRLINEREIKIVKQPQQSAIIRSRRDTILKRIGDAQSELGRLNRLLDEIRTDVLHQGIE